MVERMILRFGLVIFFVSMLVSCGKGGSSADVSNRNDNTPTAECTAKAEGGLVAGNIITLNAGSSGDDGLNRLSYLFKIVSPSGKEQISEKQTEQYYKFIPQETGFYEIMATVEYSAKIKSSAKLQLFVESLKIFGCLPAGNQSSVNVKELIWQCNGGPDTKFNVYFHKENDEPFLLEEMADSKICPLTEELGYGDKFIWKVAAENHGVKTEAQNWFRTAEDNGPPYILINVSDGKYFVGEKIELKALIEDAEGDEISAVRWELGNTPLGSNAHFDNEGGDVNFFEPDFFGDYTVVIYATDEYGHIGKSSVIITAWDMDISNEKLYLTMAYPVEGDSNVSLAAVMKWESNGLKYNVYLGESEGGMINVSQSQTCKEFDLSSVELENATYYFTRIDAERGDELLQGKVIKFKTAAALPPLPEGPDWKGDDVSMWKTGKLEIARYKDHLDASGQESLSAGAVPETRGDFNCWNNCGASIAGVMEDGILTVDITKIPLLKGANRLNIITGPDGWTQLHLFSAKDKSILVRETSASSSSGAGALVMAIYLLDDGTYSPVPDGVMVVAR